MAGIDLATAQAQLDLYIAAETKILTGQKVEIDGQALTRANLKDVRDGIDRWDAKVKELDARANGRGRSRTVSPGW